MRFIIYLLTLCFIICILTGCDIFKEKNNVNNYYPFIEDIVPNVSVIRTDMSVTLQAVATDRDGDSLSYVWTTSGGYFVEFMENKAVWQTPDSVQHVEIKCIVNDGIYIDKKIKIFTIESR